MFNQSRTRRLSNLWTASALALTIGFGPALAEQIETKEFQIAAQPLSQALLEFSQQSDAVVIASQALVGGKTAPAVAGEMAPHDALALLLTGSGLKYEQGADGQLTIIQASLQEARRDEPFRVARLDQEDGRALSNGSGQRGADEDKPDVIVVTGTNIRGVQSASPVAVYTREDIDLSGVGTVPQFVQTLPQNFGGGISESTVGVEPSGSGNLGNGTGINLRGLGNDSTLVLLNGRRVSPASLGNFVDISVIPLNAIDRVEILTDGASAIYGSDAVGGVVNFKLRKDYDGAETRVRYGTATSGDLDDVQVGQALGNAWASGHALISYEFNDRDGLDANDRAFAEDADDPTDLLPSQKRHSVFLTASQNLTDSFEVSADAFYSTRDAVSRDISQMLFAEIGSETEQVWASLATRYEFSESWDVEIVGTFSQNDVSSEIKRFTATDPESVDGITELGTRRSTTWSADGLVNGSLIDIWSGDVKLAAGGQYRRETFEDVASSKASRDIYAFLGELFVPIVSDENRRPGIEDLQLTLAGRYEDYSDFGSSTDSKFGILWSPTEGLNLRGTWGTSFRAPLLSELDDSTAVGFLVFFPNPAATTGSTLAVLARGNNPNLEPETATTWTVGFDYQPPSIQGLNFEANYFSIDFENRIEAASALLDAFTDPRWEPIIDTNPTQEFLSFLSSQPFSANFAPGFEFTDAKALIDNRLRNLARVKTRGLDFSASYAFDSNVGNFNVRLGGTYLIEQLEQLIETDAPVDVVGTPYNPTELRLRGSTSWSYDGFFSSFTVSHVDRYTDNRVDPAAPVDSWTTVDLNIGYDLGEVSSSKLLDKTTVSFVAQNVFDQDPPFVAAFPGFDIVNYDPTNANPIGRTIAFQIQKEW